MEDQVEFQLRGFIKIKDKETGEVLVEKNNAVHVGNISTKIAQALTGDNTAFITYMAFGNGGVIIDTAGNIVYRNPNVSINKNPVEQLYNTTLVMEMTNNASNVSDPVVDVPGGNIKNFEDVVASVVMEAGFPTAQSQIDNAIYSNTADTQTNFVFNELALYTGVAGLESHQDFTSIQEFLANISTILITHVIFHPVQKSVNRTLEITYTLRIQMGE